MTRAEQMVWAASYSVSLQVSLRLRDREQAIRQAISDADEAVLGLRSFAEDHGVLHIDEDLEAERRADLDLPDDDEAGKPKHVWIRRVIGRRISHETCGVCGIIRLADNEDRPCGGRPPKPGQRGDDDGGSAQGA